MPIQSFWEDVGGCFHTCIPAATPSTISGNRWPGRWSHNQTLPKTLLGLGGRRETEACASPSGLPVSLSMATCWKNTPSIGGSFG